jgi:hypothetical protein
MSLGFWLRLFNEPYFDLLIRDELKTIFPRNRIGFVGVGYGISDFRNSLQLILTLRNKVSHQEFILSPKYKVKKTYEQAVLLMKMMNESYYEHFHHLEKFKEAYDSLAETIKIMKEEGEG